MIVIATAHKLEFVPPATEASYEAHGNACISPPRYRGDILDAIDDHSISLAQFLAQANAS